MLDASAAIDALLADRGLARILARDPVAPPLLWSETLSVLHRGAWRGAFGEGVARDALARFLDAPIERRAPRRLYAEAWTIATQLGWAKTYDAEYLALARLLGCRLVTIDLGLRRAAGHLVEIVAPADL